MGFLTRREVATLYKVSVQTVDKWRKLGLLRALKINGAVRFDVRDVKALASRTGEPVKM